MTNVVFFSAANFFHQYYLSQMTPAIAAMAGIGIVTMWNHFLQPGWRGWFLPASLILTAAEQCYMIATDPTWGTGLIAVIALLTAAAALVLVLLRLRPEIITRIPSVTDLRQTLSGGAIALGMGALLLTPTIWSFNPALKNSVSDLPTAGATTMVGNAAPNNTADAKLITYLEAHQGTTTYLVATPSSNAADTLILATGKSVMALGGFTGSDPIVSATQIQQLVHKGTVRFFLIPGGNSRATINTGTTGTTNADAVINVGGPNGNNNAAVQWVAQTCTMVAASAWQSTTSTAPPTQGGFGGATTLYDCAGR